MTSPTRVHELHDRAQTQARRSGRPRWVVNLRGLLCIVDPDDWQPARDGGGRQLNHIERVAYPPAWQYTRRRRRRGDVDVTEMTIRGGENV